MAHGADAHQQTDLDRLEQAGAACHTLSRQIGQVIIGQDQIVRSLLASIFSQGHVLIIGVPGLAKTLLVKTLAQALGWTFKRVQFTPDMMPSDIIGMEILQEQRQADGHMTRTMQFVPGPIFANIVLADEINRTPPKTQAALLEAMQEYTVTSMGTSHPLARPFVVVATQNPIEQEGTYPLPEAQLDRFMLSLWMDYPSSEEEQRIVACTTEPDDAPVEQVFSTEKLAAYQQLVRRIPVSQHVIRYAVAIVRATRPTDETADDLVRKYVEWGAGPRAGQHLIQLAKALAVLEAQPTVSSRHIRQAAPLVLRHRILPQFAAGADHIDARRIVQYVLDNVQQPDY